MRIEDELDQALLDSYKRTGQEAGYWSNYFLREVRKRGSLAMLYTQNPPLGIDELRAIMGESAKK